MCSWGVGVLLGGIHRAKRQGGLRLCLEILVVGGRRIIWGILEEKVWVVSSRNLGSPGRVQSIITGKKLTHLFAHFNIKLMSCYFYCPVIEGRCAFLWKLSSGTARSRSSCFVHSSGGTHEGEVQRMESWLMLQVRAYSPVVFLP